MIKYCELCGNSWCDYPCKIAKLEQKLSDALACQSEMQGKLEEANTKIEVASHRYLNVCKQYVNEGWKLSLAVNALEDWISWEDEQIKKDGAYVRPEINELIKNGKAALKQIKGEV